MSSHAPAWRVQVAMLDWTQPLAGPQTALGSAQHAGQWASANPLYLWPRQGAGVLRMACTHVAKGPLLSDA